MDTLDGRDAYSIEEFCRAHGFSRATFYNLLAAGQGPAVMRVGSRRFVSREAAAEWRRKMEAPSQAQAV
jgi:predicted DNA-binding transcriptional regulator AlpA